MRITKRVVSFLILLQLFTIACEASVKSFYGEVVKVVDGDTIHVMHDGKAQKVRLYGIDAPERGQPFGNEARLQAAKFVAEKRVQVMVKNYDKYRRIIGVVLFDGGKNLSIEMMRAGYAWWYRMYAPKNQSLSKFQEEAQLRKVGIWKDDKAIPPWRWRQIKK